jgi:hypothetical protein
VLFRDNDMNIYSNVFLTFSDWNALWHFDCFLSFGNGCNFYSFSFSFRRDFPVLGGQQIQNNGQNSQATADTFYSDLFKNKTLKGKNNGKRTI